MEILKKRKPIVVFLLTFITPGLGQIYNGALKKGVVYIVVFDLVRLVFSALLLKFYGMIFYLAIMVGVFVFIILDALFSANKLKEIALKPYNKWYIYLVIFLLSNFAIHPLLSWTIKNNIARAYKIPSSGMEPAIFVGDHLITDMKIYKREKPKRGDIIIFEYPKDPTKEFIKRVIGLENEKVEIIQNKVYINDESMDDPWGYYEDSKLTRYMQGVENFGPVVVPEGFFFVLGDNRNNSIDSRFFGSVELTKIKGKGLYIYWSKNKGRIGMQIK